MPLHQATVGSKDRQAPHDEDEVYFVLKGTARMHPGEKEREVTAG